MDVQEFRLLLEALGPDLAAWPEPVADAAVALMMHSDAAQDLFGAAAEAEPGDANNPAIADLIAKILKAAQGEP